MRGVTFGDIAWLCAILVAAFPWGLAFVDVAAWAFTGAQLSSIPWASPRGFVLAVWPLVVGYLLAIVGGAV